MLGGMIGHRDMIEDKLREVEVHATHTIEARGQRAAVLFYLREELEGTSSFDFTGMIDADPQTLLQRAYDGLYLRRPL